MRYPFVLLLLLLAGQVSGQYYSSGSDPARLKWRQIKTSTTRLVFEQNFEKEAIRLAAFMDSVAPLVAGTLNHRPRRINLLVHNQSAYANGFVSWAPKRMELYTTSPQDIQSIEWLEHLALHEYRHVVQISKLGQSQSKLDNWFFGQQATGAVLGLYVPMWFLEGDAVITETTLTQSGRGRSFEFNQELKAQLVERGPFTYDKAYLGSFRHQVPNYYKMGYQLAGLARAQYGAHLWENALNLKGRSIVELNTFSRSLRKQIGMNKKKLYNTLFAGLTQDWTQEVNQTKTTPFTPLVASGDEFINFNYPRAINDSTLVCEMEGPGIRSQIVEINLFNGNRKTLAHTGIREAEPISANANLVVWSELDYHPRWENESFSVIRIFNRQTGKSRLLTKKSRYFAPALHPTQPRIAVVECTPGNQFFMVVLDALTGEVLERIPSPNSQPILTPSWNQDGSNLIAVLLEKAGKGLYTLDVGSHQWTMVKAPSFEEVRFPIQKGQEVWYSARGLVGEELFHLQIPDAIATRLTASRYGATHPTLLPQSGDLVYSHYTVNGYRPAQYIPGEVPNTTSDTLVSVVDQLAMKLTAQEPPVTGLPMNQAEYKSKPYSKFHLVGLHSWAPVLIDLDEGNLHSGISVMSQNLLGTTIITAGYNADPAFSPEKYKLNLSYRGFYPILDLDISMGDQLFQQDGYYANATDTFRVDFRERIQYKTIKAGLRLPFDFSKDHFMRYLEPGVKLTLEQQSGFNYTRTFYTREGDRLKPTGRSEEVKIQSVDFQGLEYGLFFYNLRRGTSRDVGYRMGQIFQGTWRHTPTGNYDAGSAMGLSTKLFFPGLARYHSWSVDNDFQSINPGSFRGTMGNYNVYNRLGNIISYPRGYTSLYNDQLYVFRFTYMMPLWNPDMALGGLVYLKRLRMNAFHDAAVVQYSLVKSDNGARETYKYTPTSTGLELHADAHFFRFVLPFGVGYRVGYRQADQRMFQEVIISTGFGGFLVNNRK